MNYFKTYNVPSYFLGGFFKKAAEKVAEKAAEYGTAIKEIFNTDRSTWKKPEKVPTREQQDYLISNGEILDLHILENPRWSASINKEQSNYLTQRMLENLDSYGYPVDAKNEHQYKKYTTLEGRDVTKPIPIKIPDNSRVRRYAQLMETVYGKKVPLDGNVYVADSRSFDNAMGYYDILRNTKINPLYYDVGENNIQSTLVHEAVSHGTDVSTMPDLILKKLFPKKYADKYGWDEPLGVLQNHYFKMHPEEDKFNKIFTSYENNPFVYSLTRPYEFRASANELREYLIDQYVKRHPETPYPSSQEEINNIIDKYRNDESLLNFFFKINGYTQQYGDIYNQLPPEEKKAFIEKLRHSLKYYASSNNRNNNTKNYYA